jgi:hypothetical protein
VSQRGIAWLPGWGASNFDGLGAALAASVMLRQWERGKRDQERRQAGSDL